MIDENEAEEVVKKIVIKSNEVNDDEVAAQSIVNNLSAHELQIAIFVLIRLLRQITPDDDTEVAADYIW